MRPASCCSAGTLGIPLPGNTSRENSAPASLSCRAHKMSVGDRTVCSLVSCRSACKTTSCRASTNTAARWRKRLVMLEADDTADVAGEGTTTSAGYLLALPCHAGVWRESDRSTRVVPLEVSASRPREEQPKRMHVHTHTHTHTHTNEYINILV